MLMVPHSVPLAQRHRRARERGRCKAPGVRLCKQTNNYQPTNVITWHNTAAGCHPGSFTSLLALRSSHVLRTPRSAPEARPGEGSVRSTGGEVMQTNQQLPTYQRHYVAQHSGCIAWRHVHQLVGTTKQPRPPFFSPRSAPQARPGEGSVRSTGGEVTQTERRTC